MLDQESAGDIVLEEVAKRQPLSLHMIVKWHEVLARHRSSFAFSHRGARKVPGRTPQQSEGRRVQQVSRSSHARDTGPVGSVVGAGACLRDSRTCIILALRSIPKRALVPSAMARTSTFTCAIDSRSSPRSIPSSAASSLSASSPGVAPPWPARLPPLPRRSSLPTSPLRERRCSAHESSSTP